MILVTGGLGYIGSHICAELLEQRYEIVIADNLENSDIKVHHVLEQISDTLVSLEIIDLCDKDKCAMLFEKYPNINTIIHCAGKKSVSESIKHPVDYYYSNLTMTLNLLTASNAKRFIFSSSATVYKAKENGVYSEKDPVEASNPYAYTKAMQEQILRDFAAVNKHITCLCLRYFNPVGAHHSGLLGENPKDIPNNLMPYILRVTANNLGIAFQEDQYKELPIYGTDYETRDGTCIRDFIHVKDLAKAHIAAIEYTPSSNWDSFNIGTGQGTTVQELIDAFKRINKVEINTVIKDRRIGDQPCAVCNPSKAENLLKWKSKLTVEDVVRSNWKYVKFNV